MDYKLVNWDNLHYDGNNLDSLNKTYNFIISERELGKTTWFWLKKAFRVFAKTKRPSIVLRRRIVDITEVYIEDIEKTINAFNEEPIEFTYRKGAIKEGVLDIYVGDDIFLRVIALSNPLSRLKSLRLDRIKYIVFDEFICNTRLGEKYVDDEAFRFKEIYTTFRRFCYESDPSQLEVLKCYFLGNPYSMYNPYFVWVGVNTKELQPGIIVKGDTWAIECGMLSQELREKILKLNPLYQFDDGYKKYAFFGQAVNDANIQLAEKCPEKFRLRHVIRIDGKYLYVYSDVSDSGFKVWDFTMWACVRDSYDGKNRAVFCFDFKDLITGTILMSVDDRQRFNYFRNCIRFRRIKFETIEASYLAEQIYMNTKNN